MFIRIQEEPIDTASLMTQLKAPEYGGIVTFSGTIREWTDELKTTEIHYTAYQKMASAQLRQLAEKIESRGARVIIVHRVGKLEIMDDAVFIGVATPHRKEAFEWCEYLIDQLKVDVPIWKKEINTTEAHWGGTSA